MLYFAFFACLLSIADSARLNRVGHNFYHATDSLIINGFDIGVQMNFVQLNSGRFLVLDTIALNASFINEINVLTNNGSLIEAVLGTHPFHTLFFPAFYKQFPNAKYYGTPRHLKVVPQVKWTGSLWDCQNRVLWPEVKMRIPRGAEFVDPQPPATNHFSGIHVYHAQSGVLHIDDTINVIFGILSFHPTIVTSGLYHIPEAPLAFGFFVQNMLNDWSLSTICCAHKATPYCNKNAASAIQTLLDVSEILLTGLSVDYAISPNQTQLAAYNAMEQHENQPLCHG